MNMRIGTLCAVVLMLGVPAAHATTYAVINTGDNGGTNPAPHAGTGTLRQAIVDSNADGGSQNVIGFSIPGSGVQTITLSAALPTLISNVGIDGLSQSGATANANLPDQGGLDAQLMIQIDGNNVGSAFVLGGAVNVSLAGLALNGFADTVVEQNASGSTLLVYGCYIGTQPDGTAFAGGYGNHGVAIRNDAGQINIGGTLPGQRNLLSGNAGGGILITQVTSPVVVEGNLIGPDATGTVAIGGGIASNWPGIIVPGNLPNIRIGCSGASCTQAGHPSRNVISGNHNYAIGIWDGFGQGAGTGGLQIKGNYMGADWTGTKPLPNGDATAGCPTYCGGIQLQGSSSIATPASAIGGLNPGEGNLIAYNKGYGIAGYANAIGASFDNEGNAIHNNGGTDIAFNLQVGRVANDPGDPDTGTNNQQNYPQIKSASVSGTPGNLTLNVTYLVDSTTANSTYPLRVDFYVDIAEGSGEYLASDSYPSASAQHARTVALPLPADVQALVGFVASATDANGYSSELSPSLVFDRIFANGFD